jgi:pilus assembly protein Flp/PilA
MSTLMRLVKEEHGQGMAEYGLILAGVAVVVMGAVLLLGEGLTGKLEEVTGKLGVEAEG